MRKFLALLLIFIGFSYATIAAIRKINLLEAHKERLVQFDVKRTSYSFKERGLKLNIHNKSKEPLVIKIDPALIFEPEDSTYQDLVLPGNEMLFVKAESIGTIEVQTYCGKSAALSPGEDLAYNYKKQGDSIMISTFEFAGLIGANADLTQKAVWFLTDIDKNLANVYSPDQDKQSQKLLIFLAKKMGYKIPEYRIESAINSEIGSIASAGKALKLHVDIEWDQPSPEVLSLSIFNDKNQRIASYFEDKMVRKGHVKISASFETYQYPKGDYFIRLYNDIGQIIKEVKVPLQ